VLFGERRQQRISAFCKLRELKASDASVLDLMRLHLTRSVQELEPPVYERGLDLGAVKPQKAGEARARDRKSCALRVTLPADWRG
jgi:hypothetical protein